MRDHARQFVGVQRLDDARGEANCCILWVSARRKSIRLIALHDIKLGHGDLSALSQYLRHFKELR